MWRHGRLGPAMLSTAKMAVELTGKRPVPRNQTTSNCHRGQGPSMGANTQAVAKNARVIAVQNGKCRPGRGLAENNLARFRTRAHDSASTGPIRCALGRFGAHRAGSGRSGKVRRRLAGGVLQDNIHLILPFPPAKMEQLRLCLVRDQLFLGWKPSLVAVAVWRQAPPSCVRRPKLGASRPRLCPSIVAIRSR